MKKVGTLATCGLLFLSPSVVLTQESPYRDHLTREIKALSTDEIARYREGAGMGLARAAELNGYPGPKHVLELEQKLAIEPEQRATVEAIFGRMHREAVRLGEEIVRQERELDREFAAGTVEPASLRERVAELARLQGELRAVHLAAHLETRASLTPAQRARYAELRGYGAGRSHGSHHDQGH